MRRLGPHPFTKLSFESRGLTVFFENESLLEKRGVGVVARTLHHALEDTATETETQRSASLFMALQSTPVKLPSSSVVVVHDLSLIELPEYASARDRHDRDLLDVCQQAGHIVVNNPRVKRRLMELYKVPFDKVTVIPNPFEPVTDLKEVPGLPDEPFMLHACSGNLHKNLPFLFRVWSELGRLAPKLVILGGYHERHKLIDDLGIRERLVFMDRLSRPEVNYVMSKSRGLLFPSDLEGFGNVVVEAALNGAATIMATDNGLEDIYADAEVIRVDRRARDWVLAVIELLTLGDSGKAEVLATRARVDFDPRSVAERYLDVLQNVSLKKKTS